jgi:hypothetical protein
MNSRLRFSQFPQNFTGDATFYYCLFRSLVFCFFGSSISFFDLGAARIRSAAKFFLLTLFGPYLEHLADRGVGLCAHTNPPKRRIPLNTHLLLIPKTPMYRTCPCSVSIQQIAIFDWLWSTHGAQRGIGLIQNFFHGLRYYVFFSFIYHDFLSKDCSDIMTLFQELSNSEPW